MSAEQPTPEPAPAEPPSEPRSLAEILRSDDDAEFDPGRVAMVPRPLDD